MALENVRQTLELVLRVRHQLRARERKPLHPSNRLGRSSRRRLRRLSLSQGRRSPLDRGSPSMGSSRPLGSSQPMGCSFESHQGKIRYVASGTQARQTQKPETNPASPTSCRWRARDSIVRSSSSSGLSRSRACQRCSRCESGDDRQCQSALVRAECISSASVGQSRAPVPRGRVTGSHAAHHASTKLQFETEEPRIGLCRWDLSRFGVIDRQSEVAQTDTLSTEIAEMLRKTTPLSFPTSSFSVTRRLLHPPSS